MMTDSLDLSSVKGRHNYCPCPPLKLESAPIYESLSGIKSYTLESIGYAWRAIYLAVYDS